MYRRYGLDFYESKLSEIEILRLFQRYEMYCFHVKRTSKGCIFATRIKDRNKLHSILPNATYLYTSGLWGMVIRNFTNKYRIFSYICMICLWMFFSNTIFAFEIYGENDKLEKNMNDIVHTFLYQRKNVDQLKKTIQIKFKDDISWLEVYENGSKITIRYTLRGKVLNNIKNNAPLIAKKNGMIAYFECDSGYKVKQVNDLVHEGDILVDNKMKDSYNRNVDVNVSGKVFAYTWQKVSVEIKNNKLPDALNYFSLLMEARDQIKINKDIGERIVKENILQFERNEGTIKIIILYTLLEDITS